MITLHEAMGRTVQWKPKDGTFGIEIETETADKSDYPEDFLLFAGEDPARGLIVYDTPKLSAWKANTDGSLRNYGIEYIFKEPLSLEDTLKAIDSFALNTKDIKFLQEQPSTSVHVHVNMQNERLLTLANFITIWTLFEIVLLEYSGPTRRSNLFASGLKKTEGIRDNYLKLFAGIEAGRPRDMIFNEAYSKYAALNIATLSRFGSLEVRCFRGSTNSTEIKNWIGILNCILEYSRTPGLTPREFLSSYRDHGPEVMSNVFGEFSHQLKCPMYNVMLDEMIPHVWRIVSSVKSWETFGLGFQKIPAVRKSKSISNDMQAFVEMAHASNNLYTWANDPAPIPVIDDIEEGEF